MRHLFAIKDLKRLILLTKSSWSDKIIEMNPLKFMVEIYTCHLLCIFRDLYSSTKLLLKDRFYRYIS